MRLAQFIEKEMQAILAEWDDFAKSLFPPAAMMTPRSLRDHAEQILAAVAKDLSTWQTMAEQSEKSMGRAIQMPGAGETAAQTHAVLRAHSGMNISQLAAEYRALRASVLRLWQEKCDPGGEGLQDVIRFNEAIDQALAESITFFSAQVDLSRNLLLGMLGHDMRNPLNAIVMTAASLRTLNAGEEVSEAAECLIRSGAAIKALLDDLVDFNRTKLGMGINIAVEEIDLAALFADELQQAEATRPDCRFELTIEGDVQGRWDGGRMQQVLRNLLSNASAYGTKGQPVRVYVQGREDSVLLEVANHCPVIEPSSLEKLFDPLRRGEADNRRANREGLGLGLYIVREIVQAHGGEVAARSDTNETVFSVRLPRKSGN